MDSFVVLTVKVYSIMWCGIASSAKSRKKWFSIGYASYIATYSTVSCCILTQKFNMAEHAGMHISYAGTDV